MGALGALDAAAQFGRARGRDEEADAARLAGLLEGGLELGTAIHRDGPDEEGHAGDQAVEEARSRGGRGAGVGFQDVAAGDDVAGGEVFETTVKGGEKVYRYGEQKCLNGMMRKNQIEIWAGLGQEQGSPVLETVDICGYVLPAVDAKVGAALAQVLRLRLQCCG